MDNLEFLQKENKLLHCLQCLPRKMVGLHNNEAHEHDNLSEFVLHELCHESCLDLPKAAYFVNNPDFQCLKGVAGICRHEMGFCQGIKDIWQEPQKYAQYMSGSPFNQKVRSIQRCSIDEQSFMDMINELSQELKLTHPEYIQWRMKYGNDGVFLFENGSVDRGLIKTYLPETVHLLGFCPIH